MKLSDEHFEQLTAYLDGELNEQERREVVALITRDPRAAALLESLRQVSNTVAALPREAAPAHLSAAVQERMARRALLNDASSAPSQLPRLVIWTNRLAVAACLALVCTAGWLGMRSNVVHAPAIVVKESARGVAEKSDSPVKEGARESLVFNADSGPTQPHAPDDHLGGKPQLPATPSDLETMVAYRDVGELEKRLNDSGVSNYDIQQADLSSFSNQIVIETDDPEMHDSIVRVVADIARKNRIPDVNSGKLPEPVQAKQSFYVVSQAQQKRSAMPGSSETWIGVNAPMNVTHELVDCVNRVRSQKKTPLQVEVNGCLMETPNQATQILAANIARNQRQWDSGSNTPAPIATESVPPPPAAAPSGGSSGRALQDSPADNESDPAQKETPESSARSSPKESKSYGQPAAAAMKITESKAPDSTEAEPRADSDDESAKRDSKGGVGGKSQPKRAGHAKDADTRNDTPVIPQSSTPAPLAKAAPAAPPSDGCVTLSICVRAPGTATTTTQASDTIRPSGATSMPQTSKPAAGADRE